MLPFSLSARSVLEAQANGVNLGLQLANGSQVLFASTARAATFLYSVAVQRMEATSFVTDNYNLDMGWLGTIDQPLLEEAEFWTERAASETGERAILDNTQASMALKIASEAPANRSDNSVTIHNDSTGNLTQITVYAAGDGSTIHDIAPSALSAIEPIVSTILNIAATVTGQYYLYIAAAALDAVQAGQAFSQGQDLAGILSLAEAVSAGILGGTGGTTPLGTTPVPDLTIAQQTAQVINLAAEGVGGVYGVVKSAQNGNGVGILASALEAAAAAAAGIGMDSGGTTQQTLNLISTALGAGSVATNVGSDFASGNLAQGLVDSLNLILPAVAAAKALDQTNQTDVSAGLEAEYQAVNNAYTLYYANQSAPTGVGNITEGLAAAIPAPTYAGGQTGTAASQYSFKINTAAFAADIGAITANGVPNLDNAISQLPAAAVPPGGYTTITTFDSTTWQFTFAADPSDGGGTGSNIDVNVQPVSGNNQANAPSTPNTISATLWGIADNTLYYLNQLFGVSSAEAAGNGTSLHSVVVQNPGQYVGAPLFVHNGDTQCVALPEDVSSVGFTSGWHMGDAVTQATPAGTIIATFGANGVYTNTPGSSHTAIVLGSDGNGGVLVAEQYVGSGRVLQADYTSGNSSPLKNLNNYHTVLVH